MAELTNFHSKIEEILTKLVKAIDNQASWTIIENSDGALIEVKSKIPAVLIGYKGENLRALGFIMNLIFQEETNRAGYQLSIDVDSWQKAHQQRLLATASKLANLARLTGKPQEMTNLSARERRMIHLALADNQNVFTRSEGEGAERKLMIIPKQT